MYSDWPLLDLADPPGCILLKIDPDTAATITRGFIRKLSESISGKSNETNTQKLIEDENDVQFSIQMIGFGLSMSFGEQYDTLHECVRLCSVWLTCVMPQPHQQVPRILQLHPVATFTSILAYLKHLFVYRDGQIELGGKRQAAEANAVIKLVQSIAVRAQPAYQPDVWDQVMAFLLSAHKLVCEGEIAHKTEKLSLVGTVSRAVFDTLVYLHSIGHAPSPAYWKTLQHQCYAYRSIPLLMGQWAATMQRLSKRLLVALFPENQHNNSLADSEPTDSILGAQLGEFEPVFLQQCWLRTLNLIRNPADLVQNAVTQRSFVRALAGIRSVVEIMSGSGEESDDARRGRGAQQHYWLRQTSLSSKPLINDLLDVFGRWLFEAAAAQPMGTDGQSVRSFDSHTSADAALMAAAASSDRGDSSSQEDTTAPGSARIDYVQAGRAEAVIALCKLLMSQSFDEVIERNHLARFYALTVLIAQQGDPYLMSVLLLHAWRLYLQERAAVSVLGPHLVEACRKCLQVVYKSPAKLHASVSVDEITCCTIKLLANMLPLAGNIQPANTVGKAGQPPTAGSGSDSLLAKCMCVLRDILSHCTNSDNVKCCLAVCAVVYELCPTQAAADPDKAKGGSINDELMCRMASGVSQRWHNDLSVCTTALNALSSCTAADCALAANTVEQVVSAVCAFIQQLLQRPPPSQSRELHSLVVVAFLTLQVWLHKHPMCLRQDRQLLATVMETIEVGIVGIKAEPISDSTKEQPFSPTVKNPASVRVQQAAVRLLNSLFTPDRSSDDAGNKFTQIERSVFTSGVDEHTQFDSYLDTKRRLLITVPRQVSTDGQAACECVLSSLDNRTHHVFRFNLLARESSSSPAPDWLQPTQTSPVKYAPGLAQLQQMPNDMRDDIAAGKIGSVTTKLDYEHTEDMQRIANAVEAAMKLNAETPDEPMQPRFIKPHPPSPKCNLGRMIIQSLGLMPLPGTKTLHKLTPASVDALLNECQPRPPFTTHLFYVSAHATQPQDALANATRLDDKDATFCLFLQLLGQVHAQPDRLNEEANTTGVNSLDGCPFVLRLPRVHHGCAALMPSQRTVDNAGSNGVCTSGSQGGVPPNAPVRPPRSKTSLQQGDAVDFDASVNQRGGQQQQHAADRLKLIVFWLQYHRDADNIDIDAYLPLTGGCDASCTSLEATVVFVSPVQHELVAASVRLPNHRSSRVSAWPLLDGCVLHVRLLAALLHHMASATATHILADSIGTQRGMSRLTTRIDEWNSQSNADKEPLSARATMLLPS